MRHVGFGKPTEFVAEATKTFVAQLSFMQASASEPDRTEVEMLYKRVMFRFLSAEVRRMLSSEFCQDSHGCKSAKGELVSSFNSGTLNRSKL